MRREILAAEIPAVAAHALLDGGGDRAVVERGAPVARDQLVGAREPRFANGSPTAGARPSGMKTSAKPGESCNARAPAAHAAPMTSVTGKPSRA